MNGVKIVSSDLFEYFSVLIAARSLHVLVELLLNAEEDAAFCIVAML
jgi:hypothetical protein